MLDATPAQADPGRVTEANPTRPDPEVPERAHRRTFTARYKLDVLAAYDAADLGEKGAILRREGLYSSHVVDWRRARDAGALAALAQPRGRRRPDPRDAKIDRLYQEKARLEQELAKARFVVSVQAKLQELLELLSESADSDSRSRRDRRRDRHPGPRAGHPGRVRGGGPAAGQPLPAAPKQPGPAAAGAGGAARPGPATGAEPGRVPGDPRRAAQRPVRRPGPHRGPGDSARRGRLPRVGLDVLPAAAPGRGEP